MDRRRFIVGSSALTATSLLPVTEANAFVPCLLRMLLRSAGGRHMLRFARAGRRVRYAGRNGHRARSIGQRRYDVRRRKEAKEVLINSRNARLFKEVGELVLDNLGNGFPKALDGNITVCSGGYKDEVYCGTFPSVQEGGKPIIMELCELQMLDHVGKHLPRLYRRDFGSDNEEISNREILSYIHPIAHIEDGDFDNDWNHYPDRPLKYRTARGIVIMNIMETEGECIIEPEDSRNSFVIPLRFSSWNNETGERA